MHAFLSATLSLGATILQRTAVVAMCSLAGWRLWTSMNSKATSVVSEPVEAAAPLAPAPAPALPVHLPSMDVLEVRPQMQRKKQKKSVRFDLVKNTLHRYTPVRGKFVAFHWRDHCVLYAHEFDPAGYDTLHCAKTKYIRAVPDLNLIDDDGDIGMNE
ncbi:MAG: hypothetical protein LQ339_004494 [Xanthoria mediterranea]|nr:MAG: hypothetical protein LQ339_004494 [Xanthoria mediterranea]